MSRLQSSTVTLGERAPALRLLNTAGEPWDLTDALANGPVLLVFAPGSWSPNTRALVAGLYHELVAFQRSGVEIALVVTEKVQTARRLLPDDGPLFPILIDDDRNAARDYGVYRAISRDGISVTRPAAFLIEQDRVVRFVYVGERDADVPTARTLAALAGWLIDPRVDEAPLEAAGFAATPAVTEPLLVPRPAAPDVATEMTAESESSDHVVSFEADTTEVPRLEADATTEAHSEALVAAEVGVVQAPSDAIVPDSPLEAMATPAEAAPGPVPPRS